MSTLTPDEAAQRVRALLLTALLAQDDDRPVRVKSRSAPHVRPSELLGCRPKAWFRIHDEPKTNPNIRRLPAILGTAIHKHIESALRRIDPFGEALLLETHVDRDGQHGIIDLKWGEYKVAVDWKSTKKSNQRYFPSQQQRVQVHTYAWMDGDTDIVVLVSIARDGTEDDIKVFAETYEEAWADMGRTWAAEVEAMDEPPPPEKPAKTFCAHYCDWYGRCPGK